MSTKTQDRLDYEADCRRHGAMPGRESKPMSRFPTLTPAGYIAEQAEILEWYGKAGTADAADRHNREVLADWFDHHGDDAEWAMERGDAAEVEKLAADLREKLDAVIAREAYEAMGE